MANNNHIPESEIELARKLRAVLEENRSIYSIDDPLIDQIMDHKKDLYLSYENELSESKRYSWEKVSGAIQEDLNKGKGTRSKTRGVTFKSIGSKKSTFLKVAAALLFAVLLSVIYLQIDFNQPEIVAQSGSTQITYTLSDESRVQLRPNSTLSIVEQSDEVIQYELKGEAFFNVTKDEDRRFLVNAGPGQIEVIGTSFNVREWSGETVVYLKDGSLSLNSSDKSREVLLQPGEAATVSSDSNITAPVQTNGHEYTSWQQNEIIFNNRTVGSIINELEYHYSIKIQMPEQIEDEVLGGTLSLENKAISLKNLGIVLGGKFSSIGNDTYQFVE